MVLSPKRTSSIDIEQQQQQEQQPWLPRELFLESFGGAENGFAGNKLDSVLQASDLPKRHGKDGIRDESDVEQDSDEVVDKGVVLEQPRRDLVVEDKGVEFEQPRVGLDRPRGNVDRLELDQPKKMMNSVEDTRSIGNEKGDESRMDPSSKNEAAGSDPEVETTTATTATTTTTLGQGNVANAEDGNAVPLVQGSLNDDDAKTTSATASASAPRPNLSLPTPPPPLGDAANKEDHVADEKIETLSPRRKDRILKQQQQQQQRASEDFDEGGEDADVAPLPFSGPISLSGYSGPMSGGSISRRSDGSSTSTRSFAFPVLPFEWNASPARMPPPAKLRSYWRNKREWFLRYICCTKPLTHP